MGRPLCGMPIFLELHGEAGLQVERGLSELRQTLPKASGELGQLLGANDHQCDHQDDEHFTKAQISEHGVTISMREERGYHRRLYIADWHCSDNRNRVEELRGGGPC